MRDYGLTALIFALIPLCLYRPWWGIIVWSWFGLMNPHRLTWDFAHDLPFAMWIGGATLFGTLFAKDRRPIPWNLELGLVAILLAYFTFTSFFAWAPQFAWVQWEKVSKIILMTFIASMFIYGKDRIRTLMLTIVFSIGFYAAKGVVFVINTGGAGRINGVEGSFLDGNTFIGLAFVMVGPLTIYLARTEQRPWLRRTLYTLVVMTFISTIFTFSRGAYLGLVAIIPMIFLRAKRKAIATCILIPTVLIVPNVVPDSVFDRIFDRVEKIEGYESDRSANQRLQSWTVAWNLAKDFPLRGAGFEFEYSPDERRWLQYTSEKYSWALTHSSSAHSIYFQILGQHGFLALGLFLVMLFGTLLSLQRTKRRTEGNPETSWIANYASGLQVGLAGYMVTGAFLSSAYFDLLYLYIALSAILGREVQSLTLQRKAQRPQGVRMMGQDIASLPRHG